MSFQKQKFSSYDPYATYSNAENRQFVESNGDFIDKHNCATTALFKIGKEAFSRLFDGCTQAEFEEACTCYHDFLEQALSSIQRITKAKGVVYISAESGQRLTPDLEHPEECQLVSLTWQFYSAGSLVGADRSDKKQLMDRKETDRLMAEMFYIYTLREIDNALMFHGWGSDGSSESIASAIDASNALANAIAIESGSEKEQEIRRDMAYRGAIEKLKRDPKQAAKTMVKECWDEWQQKPTNYKGKSAFAKDMMAKFEELDSQAVITRWCSQWERAAEK